MGTAKEDIEALLRRLPDDCSVEDVQYHLYVLEKIRLGIESAETEPMLAQDEAEVRFGKWVGAGRPGQSAGRLKPRLEQRKVRLRGLALHIWEREPTSVGFPWF